MEAREPLGSAAGADAVDEAMEARKDAEAVDKAVERREFESAAGVDAVDEAPKSGSETPMYAPPCSTSRPHSPFGESHRTE